MTTNGTCVYYCQKGQTYMCFAAIIDNPKICGDVYSRLISFIYLANKIALWFLGLRLSIPGYRPTVEVSGVFRRLVIDATVTSGLLAALLARTSASDTSVFYAVTSYLGHSTWMRHHSIQNTAPPIYIIMILLQLNWRRYVTTAESGAFRQRTFRQPVREGAFQQP